jgi:4-diphosphocytidyl-2-C-methyl-D-erythritol kinase
VSTPDREVARLAPAKLNLFLEVLARRPDGFHEVDTLLVALDRGDALRARLGAQPAGGGQVALRLGGPAATPDVPSDRTNLAVRAAEGVLALASGPPRSLWLELEKRVPSQAGLGGGSSDAVAAALASAELLGLSPGTRACGRSSRTWARTAPSSSRPVRPGSLAARAAASS